MSGKKILIIEDNPKSLRLFKMIFKDKDYIIWEVTDGVDGLNFALQNNPDLIIIDIQLPTINGLEVIKYLRRNTKFKKTPIIAVTAYAMEGDRRKIMASGCTAYFSKPVDTREFPKVVEYWLDEENIKNKDEVENK